MGTDLKKARKNLAQGHSANEWRSGDLTSDWPDSWAALSNTVATSHMPLSS